jgi:hypothetical protein
MIKFNSWFTVKNSLDDLWYFFVLLAIIFLVVTQLLFYIHSCESLCAQMELNIKRMRKSSPMRDACMRGLVIVCDIRARRGERVRVRVHVINLEHCVTGYRHLLNLKIIGPTFNLIIKWSLIIWWWTKIKFVTLKSLCGTCLLCWAAAHGRMSSNDAQHTLSNCS